MARFAVLVSLLFVLNALLFAQTPVSDPQALSIVARSVAAMTAGNPVIDIGLTGNATWFVGSDVETGTATLLGKGTTESLVALSLSGGKRIEYRNSLTGSPRGKWINHDGTSGLYSWHNCWADAVWFFPVLSALADASNSSFVFSFVGQETINGLVVQHLRVFQLAPVGTSPNLPITLLSARDIFLDSASLLPVVIAFNVHPDNDSNTNVLEEIRFADYRVVNGIRVPFHLQQVTGGSLALDVVVTQAVVNRGLSDTQFNF